MAYDPSEESRRIIELITAAIENRLTANETAELQNWIAEKPENQQLYDQLTDEKYRNQILHQWQPTAADQSLKRLKAKIGARKRPALLPRIAAAASIVLGLSFGSYFLFHKKPAVKQLVQNQTHDIKPGGNKATLILAGGKQVLLTGTKNGRIAKQGVMAINKTANGQIVYNAVTASQPLESVMNTVTTPRGGKWFVELADGTKVWLNAASSITYPTAFTGNDREVSITGEAYFEVAHNAAKPFRVASNGQTVEVLGTHFDINTYSDEPEIKTTLFEGSVKVSDASEVAILKPGQQAQLKANSPIRVVQDDDPERTLAWKNGLFIFNRTDMHTLMRQLSRWYDVDVVYEGDVKNDIFFGKIKQDNNLSEILKVLELGDVHFRIEGKKLIVLP